MQRLSTKQFSSFFVTLLITILMCVTPQPAKAIGSAEMTVEDLMKLNKPQFRDLETMANEKVIRVLMPISKTFYFFDGAEQKGISYELALLFEKFVNEKYKLKNNKIHVFIIPTPRAKLLPRLEKGLGDIAVGNLTITKERSQIVDFGNPSLKNVSEILVTDKSKTITNLFDLSGQEIHARKSSSYYESLLRLNDLLASMDKKPVKIVEAEELLEDEDLLEMVNAGLIPAIIIDDHKGKFWVQIFDNIKLHQDIKVNSGGSIAWALRKNTPELMKLVNEFTAKNKKGTLTGNILFNRYLKNTKYITNSTHNEDAQRFKDLVNYFKKYGDQYNFDHLMLAALAYQESRLDQSVKSHVGAVGVMQVLPSTAKDKNVGISKIDQVGPNIHAGTKYLRFMRDRYFKKNEEMDEFNRALFSFASYNAGPAKIARLQKEAAEQGLDPNVWFNNVEIIASKRIGRETVQYVSNIFKYYVAYKLTNVEQAEKENK